MTFRPPLSTMSQIFLAALLLCAASLFAQTPSFVSFDAPGAGTGPGEGTEATCINSKGLVAGYYIDGSDISHGFVRSTSGVITEFTPPAFQNPIVVSVNIRGEVVGSGFAQSGTQSGTFGFIRRIDGSVLHVIVPRSTSTQPTGIDDSEEVTGSYTDSAFATHGFLRSSSGVYTTFDYPGDSNNTRPLAINNNGSVTGYYNDANTGGPRGFVRDQFGNFTNFDANAGGSDFILPAAINLSGEVAGYYDSSNTQGFIRDASGTITQLDVPGAMSTLPKAINDSGVIIGWWLDIGFNTFGFERDTAGNITSFSLPVANRGVLPRAINNSGRIAGNYFDKINALHSFVR